MPYAEKTEVPTDRSKSEIERMLKKAGAEQFAYMADKGRALLLFRVDNRHIKMVVPLPVSKRGSSAFSPCACAKRRTVPRALPISTRARTTASATG